MPYPHRLLHEAEDVVLDERPHFIGLLRPLLLAAVVLAALVAVFVLWSHAPAWFGFVLLAALLLDAGYRGTRLLQWRSTELVLTTSRVIYRSGLLHRFGREIPIDAVQDVTYRQGILERIAGAGSLTVESAGERGAEAFPNIRHPEGVQSLINRTVEQARRVPSSEPSGGEPSVLEQLERLGELQRRGVITDAEFAEKKAELLGRL